MLRVLPYSYRRNLQCLLLNGTTFHNKKRFYHENKQNSYQSNSEYNFDFPQTIPTKIIIPGLAAGYVYYDLWNTWNENSVYSIEEAVDSSIDRNTEETIKHKVKGLLFISPIVMLTFASGLLISNAGLLLPAFVIFSTTYFSGD